MLVVKEVSFDEKYQRYIIDVQDQFKVSRFYYKNGDVNSQNGILFPTEYYELVIETMNKQLRNQ